MEELKKEFSQKFYDGIVKLGFLSDLNEIVNENGLINIDLNDIKQLASGELVGVISQESNDFEEVFEMNRLNDLNPTNCILNIITDISISLSDVDKIVKNIRSIDENLNIIYGCRLVDNLKYKYKIQAIFTYNEEFKKSDNENNNKKVITYDDKDIAYDIALHFVDGCPISINRIQCDYPLGFNRTSRIFKILEDLGIISKKIGENPRKLLINDKEKIKELIYK